jgi:hypothetical protein
VKFWRRTSGLVFLLLIWTVLLRADNLDSLGIQIERILDQKDFATFGKLIDVEALTDRILQEAPGSKELQNDFRAAMREKYKSAKVGEWMKIYSRVRYGGIRTFDGRQQLLFSSIGWQGYLGYWMILPKQEPDGAWRIADMFVLTEGEYLSHRSRRTYLQWVWRTETEAIKLASGEDRAYLVSLPAIGTLENQGPVGDERFYAQFPEKTQTSKLALGARITAGWRGSEENLLKILALWKKNYPDDPSVELLTAMIFNNHQKYEECLAALSRFDSQIGGEAELHAWRANLFWVLKKDKEAKDAAWLAINMDPRCEGAWKLLMDPLLAGEQFRDVAQLLSQKESLLQIDLRPEVKKDSAFVKFRQSKVYERWAGMKAGTGAPAIPKPTVPTSPANAAPAPEPEEVAKEDPKQPKLQGIFYHATKPTALISGQTTAPGDVVLGHKVLKIDRASVTILTPSGETNVLSFGGR